MSIDLRKTLVDKEHVYFTVEDQCSMLSIPRSTYYYRPIGISETDLEIMRVMDEMYLEDPTRGTRRYSGELLARGYCLGRDHARTLMRIMGIHAIYQQPRTTVIDKTKYKYPYLLRGLEINEPNQAWAIDISYIPMRHGFMYLTAIIDIYSRFIVGWSISNTMEATWVVETLKNAVEVHGKPKIINSDQGSQFTSDEYVNYVKSLKSTRISMDGKGRATDNAFIERFFRTIKYDKLYLEPSEDGRHLNLQCSEFIHFYNSKRGHSQHNYATPKYVYQQVA